MRFPLHRPLHACKMRAVRGALATTILAGILLSPGFPHRAMGASGAARWTRSSAQSSAASDTAAASNEKMVAQSPQSDQQETPDEKDEYRLSSMTRTLARTLHISPRATAAWLEALNAAVLFGIMFWVMRSKLPVFFRGRSERLRAQLVEARSATEDANHRLLAIEQRLSKLDEEIIGMRDTSERAVAHEEERFREALETEKQRIVTAAEQEIDNASHAARRSLKLFAADLAVETAERRLNLTPELDAQMMDEFLAGLGDKS